MLATAQAVKAHIDALDAFFAADIAVLRGGMPQGPYAVIYPQSIRVEQTTMLSTIEHHTLRVDIHVSPSARDQRERVLEGARLASQLLDSIYADFTLGGTVRNVDVVGIEVDFSEREFEDVPSRVAEITLPLIVDGTQPFAP